jgi:hypothetical protein
MPTLLPIHPGKCFQIPATLLERQQILLCIDLDAGNLPVNKTGTKSPHRPMAKPKPKASVPTSALDRLDFAILRALQRDARLSLAEISAEVGLSTSPCWTRIKRLEDSGVIDGYSLRLNAEKIGLKDTVIVQLTLDINGRPSLAPLKPHARALGTRFAMRVACQLPRARALHPHPHPHPRFA